MNTLGITRIWAVALLCCAHMTSAMAITFTHDAFISFADVSNEGQDIVVTNCTLTVDGPHTFNSLQLLNGGVLTHSALPYGPQQITFSVFGETHVMSATNAATLNNTNVDTSTIEVMNTSATIVYTENVDYLVTVSNQFIQLTLTTNSAILEGATVLVDYDWAQSFQGFTLTINGDAKVAPGGAINVSGKGYAGGIGANNGAGTSRTTNSPFVFTAGGGAGHGGAGGMSSTFARGGATYDSTTNPAALGCGGGTGSADGGAGGGSASLFVGGDFQVDGQILAGGFRGTNAHSGGGSGGSILISARDISGAGTISANGGSGDTPDGGGGGGGRIAIYSHTNDFSGNLTAFGGGGANIGGAGTVYFKSGTNFFGQLFIVNGGKRGTNTTFSGTVGDLTISGGAILQAPILPLSVANLYVGSNSSLASLDSLPLTVTVGGNATVDPTAMINADFKSSTGPGTGTAVGSCFGAGGSYGGFGGMSACGARGGLVYGSIGQPSNLGSPGTSGARAGGAIKMIVGGTLSNSGTISANGDSAIAATSGGGSGGSVWLTVGTLSGAGTISANGGSASNLVSGGGGGGRVAIYFSTNLFSGSIAAHGGAGTNSGGAGSVYLKSGSDPIPQIIFNNGGLVGNTTLVDTLVTSDLTISGGAVLTNSFQALSVIRNLFIGSNSWFTSFPYPTTSLSVTVTNNATIQSGGGIITDANSASSLGAGQSINLIGGGGGDAGNGGLGGTNAAGGTMVASHSLPTAGGGRGGAGTGPGGLGGGVINLIVSGTLILDGQISANGGAGPALNSGGGAGGGIRVSARTLSGAGIISANGGAGNSLGGGGGGGAIAVDSNTNLFLGSITAVGGSGSQFGGAGTIYKVPFALGGKAAPLTMDNGGHRGAITPLGSSSDVSDLIITGGAMVSNSVVISQMTSVVVGSNSVLQVYFGDLTASNITILAGGSINEDGANTSGTPGLGQTLNSSGGGGGGAGTGGASALGAAGGVAISTTFSQPTAPGGRGGGAGQTLNSGGNGGGQLRITVLNTLLVDGRLSADGAPGAGLNSGGGAGGSLWLTVKTLAGSGVISANGGAGNFAGGGGGGGHLGILRATDTFTGTLTARGGSGANFGGAGLVFLGPNPSLPSPLTMQLILDNGGVVGGFTPLFSPVEGNSSLTIKGGAILTNATASLLRNLFIGTNSTWIANPPSAFNLTVLTNATIEAGGLLTADGTSAFGQSPGQSGGTRGGGGGGHGGYGGASFSNILGGNVTADSITTPQLAGSPGGSGGGFGGGTLRLNVSGTLQLDGRISANGGMNSSNLNSGGGSGGSVWVIARKLAGAGIISANGGAANNLGGGGGGGRVAVSYNTNVFTGAITARGGPGANFGGAGTVYLSRSVDLGGSAQLVIDNGGARGTNTLLPPNFGSANVIITNGGSVNLASAAFGAPTWNSLTIYSNSSLSGFSNSPIQLTISSNLDVQAGGALMLDGQGYGANAGLGAGFASSGQGAGAGHGGFGSAAANTNGGVSYDSITSPGLTGSGGGSLSATSGSAGGGAAFLTVKGVCTINGVISANGTAGIVAGAGGGSGGSLHLVAGAISGTGKISADGGNGDVFTSGGGAGGRIALYFGSNLFSGIISAHGGAGVGLAGGAGTIYFKTNSSPVAQLIIDNGGLAGTTTPLSAPNPLLQVPVALSIRNRGKADSTSPLTLQSLSIAADSGIISHSLVPLNITVLGNALVDTNAIFTADAAGYDILGAGPGTGGVDFAGDGGGGGYGGAGGASFYGAPGGSTYGSSNQPVDFGSPGRMTPVLSGFSQGGGAIRLAVNGVLTVNGNISADGADGFIDGSGGGSGGSIWVIAQTLSGNGSFTANGGQGESFEGGGGGGGRIAIYAPTNFFTGTISAMGGDGASPGQDGTIYVPTSFLISGVVTNLNGKGVPGITLQPSGLLAQTSDTNGFYSVSVPLYWSGSIVPSANGVVFPNSRTYVSVSQDMPNQSFLFNSTSTLIITGTPFLDNSYFTVSWFALNGVYYQVQYSTNLVDWVPVAPIYIGNDAPRETVVPTGNAPQMYFRINSY
jgi:hypothetical protein